MQLSSVRRHETCSDNLLTPTLYLLPIYKTVTVPIFQIFVLLSIFGACQILLIQSCTASKRCMFAWCLLLGLKLSGEIRNKIGKPTGENLPLVKACTQVSSYHWFNGQSTELK